MLEFEKNLNVVDSKEKLYIGTAIIVLESFND